MDVSAENTTLTTWLIIGSAFIWLGYDVYLYVPNKPTISDKMTKWGKHMMAIVFLLGFIMGHWFW